MSNKGIDPATGWEHEGGGVWVPPLAPSAEAMPEPQAHEARCSVASGSLPVSSAEALVRRWRAQRDDSAKAQAACAAAGDKEGEAMWDGMATALNGSANDMLRELEHANKRQPEENNPGQTPEGRSPGGCL